MLNKKVLKKIYKKTQGSYTKKSFIRKLMEWHEYLKYKPDYVIIELEKQRLIAWGKEFKLSTKVNKILSNQNYEKDKKGQ